RQTGTSLAQGASQIQNFLEKFSITSGEYTKSLAALTNQNSTVADKISGLSSQMAAAASSVTKATTAVDGNLAKLLDGIREFAHLAGETNRASRESQESVRHSVQTLQQQMSIHLQRFDTVDQKLATVFTSIGAHLELQAKQMAEQF